MLTVTPKAVKELELNRKQFGSVFEVIFQGYGWGGPKLGLVRSQKSEDSEGMVSISGFSFYLDKSFKGLVKMYGELIIDFVDDIWGKGFSVSFQHLGSSSCWTSDNKTGTYNYP